MENDIIVLMNNIASIDGYQKLPQEEQQLINHVAKNYLKNKISANVAAKRITALFGKEMALSEVNAVFKAFSMKIPLEEYKKNFIKNMPRKSGGWSNIEDEKLIEAVKKLGTNDWQAISDFVGNGRTKSQCSQRWERTLDPTISREEWSHEETQKLINAVKKYGLKSWVKVAKFVGSRSDVQCRYKYNTSIAAQPRNDLYVGTIKQKSPILLDSKEKTIETREEKDRLSFLDKIDFAEDMISNITF